MAKERGIRIYTVAIGDPATAGEEKLDEAALRIALGSGGSYFFAGDRRLQLAGIYTELDKIETREGEGHQSPPTQRFVLRWPLLAALVLWLVEIAFVVMRQSRATVSHSSISVHVNQRTGKLEVAA